MFAIELEWERASQYVVRAVKVHSKRYVSIFPAEAATVLRHHPLEINASLYAEFAGLDGSEASCLGFAHKYGLLSAQPKRYPGWEDHGTLAVVESLEFWRAQIENVRKIIRRCELSRDNPAEAFRQLGKRDFEIGSVEIYLSIKSPKSPLSVEVRASSLIHGIQLQAVQSILEGRRSFHCFECSRPFQVGIGARRSHSKFCSTRCKDSYHNRLKAQGRRTQHA